MSINTTPINLQSNVANREEVLAQPGLTSAGRPFLIVIVAVLVGVLLIPFVPDIKFYSLSVIILVFVYGGLATAWSIAGGYAGSHSVGHAAFVGLGAYTSTILLRDFNLSPWIGMLFGMVVAGLVAALLGYLTFRSGLRGDYFTLATVAAGMVIYELANGLPKLTAGSQGLPISYEPNPWMFQFSDRNVYYYVAFAMWLAIVVIAYRIRKSRMGYEMLAVRDDEAAAARGGISVMRAKLGSFIISAALCAAIGTFLAQFYLYIDPMSVMSLAMSVQIILIAALGGMNSYLGGTLGALILVPIMQWLATVLQGYPGVDLAIYGLVLVLVMIFMPFGVLGLLRKSTKWRKVIGW
ncbi:branched-chain amino acid ABC transporter permease [Leucobacter celer]|uniref:branched-chain amino acid ABC transporter permease n=1 Tax=Leucobacter celer TaxID=668625 RepID=UPI0006A7B3FC|nr:branched-chain amino acid ABC transporter permease [Leucobacter celer]